MSLPTHFKLNNGVQIPSVQMGVWQGGFGGEAIGLSDAIEVGYRGFDTAKAYANEALVGKAIRESGLPRSDFFVTTKLGNSDHGRVAEAFQDSLDQLNLEDGILDLYLMHWPGHEPPSFNETWTAMEQIYDSGRVRAIGVSNFSIKTLEELLTTAKIVPAVNQIEGHPYLPDDELKAYCDTKGIHLTYYSPLGSSTRDSGISPILTEPDLKDIAAAHDVSVAQVALSWAVQRGASVAPRSTHKDRQRQNLSLVVLSPDEVRRIDAIHKSDPLKHTRLCTAPYRKEAGTAGGWTFERLGWDIGYKLA